MRESGAYGPRLANIFGADEAPCIVARSLRGAEVAITEVRAEHAAGQMTEPIPPEDAYLVSLTLREYPNNLYWENGCSTPTRSLRAGVVLIHDLRRSPAMLRDKPIHSLLFYLPRATLDAVADEANLPRIEELRYEPGVGMTDETLRNMGAALLPALRRPDEVGRLFFDHLALAITAHIARVYGGLPTSPRLARGGLAPWQEKRAKSMLGADLTGETSLQEIARACGLSVSYFSRAFRRSTGLAPHAWLLRHRVETAKAMLRERAAPLAAIALACGFADQSHFTRVFSRQVGVSPGAWRNCWEPGAGSEPDGMAMSRAA